MGLARASAAQDSNHVSSRVVATAADIAAHGCSGARNCIALTGFLRSGPFGWQVLQSRAVPHHDARHMYAATMASSDGDVSAMLVTQAWVHHAPLRLRRCAVALRSVIHFYEACAAEIEDDVDVKNPNISSTDGLIRPGAFPLRRLLRICRLRHLHQPLQTHQHLCRPLWSRQRQPLLLVGIPVSLRCRRVLYIFSFSVWMHKVMHLIPRIVHVLRSGTLEDCPARPPYGIHLFSFLFALFQCATKSMPP